MKPYSKKYLTLALAGVLAASIPVSAFAANTNDGLKDAQDRNKITETKNNDQNKKNDDENQPDKTTEKEADTTTLEIVRLL